MCSVIAGLTALGGIFQYRQQQQQANAPASMYRAQADAAEQNARIENRKQEQIADNYAAQADKLRSRRRLFVGCLWVLFGVVGLFFGGLVLVFFSSERGQPAGTDLRGRLELRRLGHGYPLVE